jgi:hypothetical protein
MRLATSCGSMGFRSRLSKSCGMRSRSIPRRAFPNIKAVFALVTAGVEMDVLGVAFNEFDEQRMLGVVAAHPRGNHFKENIIDAFYHGWCIGRIALWHVRAF